MLLEDDAAEEYIKQHDEVCSLLDLIINNVCCLPSNPAGELEQHISLDLPSGRIRCNVSLGFMGTDNKEPYAWSVKVFGGIQLLFSYGVRFCNVLVDKLDIDNMPVLQQIHEELYEHLGKLEDNNGKED